MKFYHGIFAEESPVRLQEIIERRGRIERRPIERKKTDSLVNRLDPFRERESRIEITKQKWTPTFERDLREIVLFARKICNALERRHRNERTIEPEFSAMITPPHSFDLPLASYPHP